MLTTTDRPPGPVLHSTFGPLVTGSNVFDVTVTFDSAVTGVAVSDFNGGTAFPTEAGVSYALAGSGTEWVLTVTVDASPRVDKAFSFAVAANSGSISPPTTATPTPFTLTCVANGAACGAYPPPTQI